MTEEITAPIQDNVETPSTVIDEGLDTNKSGGGKVAPEPAEQKEAPRKSESVRDSLEAEFKRAEKNQTPQDDDGDEENKAEKPQTPAKDDKQAVEKDRPKESAPKADTGVPEDKVNQRQSEGRKIIEAPARLIPAAREAWKNVPTPVREEWVRIERERDEEINRYRESHQFREELREYEEMGRKHNVSIKQALDNYVGIERKFSENPPEGFRQLLSNLGMNPTQAMGHLMAAYGVKPEQVAAHIQQHPHEYTVLASRPTQQQQPAPAQREDPRVQQLEQRLQAMETERVANEVIRPFREEYPEYDQYENQIAEILKSGIVERIHGTGLSPRHKLEVALFMVNPSSNRGSNVESLESVRNPNHDNTPPAGVLRGDKSIKSSVGAVTDPVEPERKMSMREMLEEEARKMARRA